jgi:N-acetylneuraminic acid mutarotase
LLGQCFEVIPPALPLQLWSLAAAADLDGGVYAIGGEDVYGRSHAVVYRFTGSQEGWVSMQPLATARASLAATTGLDGKIYALGGAVGLVPSGAAEVYDSALNQWSALPSLPTPRVWLAAATAADGRIYALGGQLITRSDLPDGGVAHSYTASNAVEIYDPATGTWSSGPSLLTARIALAAVRGRDGAIYAMGGQTDQATPTDVVERLSPDGGWEAIAPLSSKRTGLAAAVGPDGHLYAISGNIPGGATVGTVDVYDLDAGSWSQVSDLLTPRFGLAAATAAGPNGYIYTVGGAVSGPLNAVLSTVEVLALVDGYSQWQ